MTRALCNNCLADVEAWATGDSCELTCPHCNGEACDCASCMGCLEALHAGNRDPRALGLCNVADGFAWTPEKGTAQ